MSEVASAYVSLIPSLRGGDKEIQKQLGDAGDRAGATGGERASKSLLGRLGSGLKAGAIGVGVAVGGVLAASLVKGWGRLSSIENATAKLTGLGNSAKSVSSIMDNALASVKGTAFGLDEAATTAAAVVAAGIKPGKDLQGVLKTVADTATIAGKSMADTGAIFGSVAARGKLQGDDLMQLQSAGVPVLAMLAKHYGVTAAAASEMVSKGKVDFKNFNAALSENLGGAALKSGETTAGAFKNMGAAFSRLGAALVGPVFDGAKGFFVMITNGVDALTSKVGPIVTAISGKLRALGSTLLAQGGALAKFRDNVKTVFAGLGTAIGAAFSGDFSGLATIGQRLVDALVKYLPQMLTSGQMLIIRLIDGALDMLPKILDIAGEIIEKLTSALVRLIPKLAAAAAPIISKLVDALSKALPQLLTVGVSAVGAIIDGIVKALPQIVRAASGLVVQLGQALVKMLPQLLRAAVQLAMSIVDGLTKILPDLVNAAVQIVTGLAGALVANLPALVTAAVGMVQAILQGLLDNLPVLINAALTLVQSLITSMLTMLPQLIDAGLQILRGVIKGVIDNLPAIIDMALSVVTQLVTALIDALPQLVDAGLELLLGIVDGIINNLPKIIDAGLKMLDSLIKALINNLPKIIDAALKLIVGLVNGLLNNLPKLVDAAFRLITGLVKALIDNLPLLVEAAVKLVVAIGQAIVTNAPEMLKAGWALITSLASGIWNLAKDLLSGLLSLGKKMIGAIWEGLGNLASFGWDLVQGLWRGIQSLGGWIKDKIVGFFQWIWDSVLALFGISSPSKEAAWAGEMIGRGMVKGLDGMRGLVGSAADRLADAAMPTVGSPRLAFSGIGGGTYASGGVSAGSPHALTVELVVRGDGPLSQAIAAGADARIVAHASSSARSARLLARAGA